MGDIITIDDVELSEAPPVSWTGNPELLGLDEARTLLRLALERDPSDPDEVSFTPCLCGPAGCGKTTLAFQAAREHSNGRGVYAVQCAPDMTAEDLCVTPVLAQDRRVRYQMSGLATAAWRGAAVVLDEASRLQPLSWATILPVLDERRCLTSHVAGINIPVREGFCLILTLNRSEETFELPSAVRSRLGPFIEIGPIALEHQVSMLGRQLQGASADEIRRGLEYLRREAASPDELAPRTLIATFRLYRRIRFAGGRTPPGKAMTRAMSAMMVPRRGAGGSAEGSPAPPPSAPAPRST